MFDGIDGERYGCQHEKHCRNRSGFGERSGCASRAERRLAPLPTESRRNVSGLAALQENNNNQKETDDDVDDRDENNHGNREILNCSE